MDTVYKVSMQKPFALSHTLWDSSAGLATPKAQGFLSITQAATEQDSRLSKERRGGWKQHGERTMACSLGTMEFTH